MVVDEADSAAALAVVEVDEEASSRTTDLRILCSVSFAQFSRPA